MAENKTTDYIKPLSDQTNELRFYIPEIQKFRVILLAASLLFTFGIHPEIQTLSSILLGFSIPALFIISGFLVLRVDQNREKRILRTILRTGLCFLVLAVCYFGLSWLAEPKTTAALLYSKAFWVDFLLLNYCRLPMGSTIWYVQALLYAYIIIYIIYKLHLIKLDIVFAVLCLAATFIMGDGAALFDFSFSGHAYISGNFLTRALPYILIGCFIARCINYFSNLSITHIVLLIISGFALSFLEYFILLINNKLCYTSHMVGTTFIAVGVALLVLFTSGAELPGVFENRHRIELMIPYFIASPILYLANLLLLNSSEDIQYYLGNFLSVLTVLFSFVILYVYCLIKEYFLQRRIFIMQEIAEENYFHNQEESETVLEIQEENKQ